MSTPFENKRKRLSPISRIMDLVAEGIVRLIDVPWRLPSFFKNFYFLTTVLFIAWMLFFDSNDVFTQFERVKRLKQLEKDKSYYKKETARMEEQLKHLSSNRGTLEQFAREYYLYRKPSEDVYLIVEENPQKVTPKTLQQTTTQKSEIEKK